MAFLPTYYMLFAIVAHALSTYGCTPHFRKYRRGVSRPHRHALRNSANEKLPYRLFFEVSYASPSASYFRDSLHKNAAPWRFYLLPVGERRFLRKIPTLLRGFVFWHNRKAKRGYSAFAEYLLFLFLSCALPSILCTLTAFFGYFAKIGEKVLQKSKKDV